MQFSSWPQRCTLVFAHIETKLGLCRKKKTGSHIKFSFIHACTHAHFDWFRDFDGKLANNNHYSSIVNQMWMLLFFRVCDKNQCMQRKNGSHWAAFVYLFIKFQMQTEREHGFPLFECRKHAEKYYNFSPACR